MKEIVWRGLTFSVLASQEELTSPGFVPTEWYAQVDERGGFIKVELLNDGHYRAEFGGVVSATAAYDSTATGALAFRPLRWETPQAALDSAFDSYCQGWEATIRNAQYALNRVQKLRSEVI